LIMQNMVCGAGLIVTGFALGFPLGALYGEK
jgi:hypothetical protein